MIKETQLFLPFLENLSKQILEIYNSDFSHEIKNDNSPLTQADLLVHRELTQFIKKNFPDDSIISEEDEIIPLSYSSRVWVIDPIDGTKDFVKKTGEFSIMIGLLQENKPLFGLVYIPVTGICYSAKIGEGSYVTKNSKTTVLEVDSSDSEITLVTSRNNFKEQDQKIVDVLNITKFKTMGSIGVKFSSIANGNANLCFYSTSGLGIWDALPVHVILEEAGGHIFDRNGNSLVYNLQNRTMLKGVIGCSNVEIKKKFLDSYQKIIE